LIVWAPVSTAPFALFVVAVTVEKIGQRGERRTVVIIINETTQQGAFIA